MVIETATAPVRLRSPSARSVFPRSSRPRPFSSLPFLPRGSVEVPSRFHRQACFRALSLLPGGGIHACTLLTVRRCRFPGLPHHRSGTSFLSHCAQHCCSLHLNLSIGLWGDAPARAPLAPQRRLVCVRSPARGPRPVRVLRIFHQRCLSHRDQAFTWSWTSLSRVPFCIG